MPGSRPRTNARKPRLVLSRERVRALDRRAAAEFGLAGLVLMENAGRAVAERAGALRGPRGRVLVLAGPGANGGDGLVAARHLDAAGVPVRVVLVGGEARPGGDAAANLAVLRAMGLPVESGDGVAGGRRLSRRLARLRAGDVIVDALLGTGLNRPVDPASDLGRAVEVVNRRTTRAGRGGRASTPRVLAVDVPSGLDAESGLGLVGLGAAAGGGGSAVRADETLTLVAVKPGLIARGARAWTGRVCVARIGVPRRLVEELAGGGRAARGGYAHSRDVARAAEVD